MVTRFLNCLLLGKKCDRQFAGRVNQISNGKPVHIFLITKPLQYMNLKAIDLDANAFSLLIVVNAFADAAKFTDFIRETDSSWDMVEFFNQEEEAQASILPIKNIAVYWNAMDYGVINNFFMKELHNRKCRICLIEEGIGNYAKSDVAFSIYHPFLAKHRWISKLCFEWIRELAHLISGCGTGINTSKWTKEIHLYYPQYPLIPCRSRKVLRQLKFSPCENFKKLDRFFDFSAYPWLDEMKDQEVLLLPTEWSGTAIYDESDLKKYDALIVKYHPHIKDKKSDGQNQIKYMAGSLPTEILIFKLLNQNCSITLRAKFTSSFIYLTGSGINMEFERNDIPDFMNGFFNFVTEENNKTAV